MVQSTEHVVQCVCGMVQHYFGPSQRNILHVFVHSFCTIFLRGKSIFIYLGTIILAMISPTRTVQEWGEGQTSVKIVAARQPFLNGKEHRWRELGMMGDVTVRSGVSRVASEQ